MWGSRSTPRLASASPVPSVEPQSSPWECKEHWSGHVFCGALASAAVPSEPSPRLQSSGPAIPGAMRTIRFSYEKTKQIKYHSHR